MFLRMFVHVFSCCFVSSLYNLLFIIQKNIILGQSEDENNKGKSVHFINYLCLVHIGRVNEFQLQSGC